VHKLQILGSLETTILCMFSSRNQYGSKST